jgi:hypothetical protein
MPLIALEVYRHLFTNETAMAEFAGILERATQEDDMPLVTFQDRHIVTALSPRATERFLSDRILRRFVEKPEPLDTLVRRLRDLKEGDVIA